jgi:hypothetical protein
MQNTSSAKNNIREHMMVQAQGEGSMQGIPGVHVGSVDYVDGDQIVLTKNDSPDNQHHAFPMSLVDKVEGNTVFLSCDQETLEEEWETVEPTEEQDPS